MKRWMHKLEVIVDKAISPCLIVLLFIIVLDLGFKDMVEAYNLHTPIIVIDYMIISIFVIDLIFKYLRVKDVPTFFKKYWLDILAVFPFFLLFRTYELFFGATVLSEGAQTAQAVVHEGVKIEEGGAKMFSDAEKIAKEAEAAGKVRRATRFTRYLRPILRIPRLAKAAPKVTEFYEKPHGGHHNRDFMAKVKRR
jgi:hypothetical protein